MKDFQKALDDMNTWYGISSYSILPSKSNVSTYKKASREEGEKDRKDLQELVDKEKPMKPFLNRKKRNGSLYHCHYCGKDLPEIGNIDYCPFCGQHLDWSKKK